MKFKWTLQNKIMAGSLLPIILVLILGYSSYENVKKMDDLAHWVDHTNIVLAQATAVEKLIIDLETGERGFLLTGKENFLEPFKTGKEKLGSAFSELSNLIGDNPAQVGKLNEIEILMTEWINAAAEPLIQLRRGVTKSAATMEDVASLVESEVGKVIMDEIRVRLSKFKEVEQKLLVKRQLESKEENALVKSIISVGVGLVVLLTLFGTFWISRFTTRPIMSLSAVSKRVLEGDTNARANLSSSDEVGQLGNAFDEMLNGLNASKKEAELKSKDLEGQNWVKTSLGELADIIRGEQTPMELAQNIIQYLVPALKAQIGAFYLVEGDTLKMVSSYAYNKRKILGNEFRLGEGLVGQVALEKKEIILTKVPDDYISVSSGLGEAVPKNIMVMPLLFEEELEGVIELGSFNEFDDLQNQLLNQALGILGSSLKSAESREQMARLLKETQKQATELESQQEEMRATNEELESQSSELQKSEHELLQKQQDLAKQNSVIEEKAKQLESASKYKSEFLANMSHELRTPLNSLLILSQLLAENKDKNLTEKQLEFANTIHGSGSDLLTLINDILDLSKVEAGKLDLNLEEVALSDLAASIESNFKHVAEDKSLFLKVESDKGLPVSIRNDSVRLNQVIKNLLSNAFKFTSKGGITVKFQPVDSSVVFSHMSQKHQDSLAISVTDTGSGISKDKQHAIFEAFQQEDGSTSRKYGGTGLGLSISKEFVKLMNGEIHIDSQLGNGSTFTIYIPRKVVGRKLAEKDETGEITTPVSASDFQSHAPKTAGSDHLILIVEDDPKFANILFELAQDNGFEAIIASDGETGLTLIAQHRPAAILLDIGLPGMDGLTVMDKIKENPQTRDIPVHFLSAMDKSEEAMKKGAVGFLSKPISPEGLAGVFGKLENMISRTPKNLLLVEDDEKMRTSIIELLKKEDVGITSVSMGQEALDLLATQVYDCMILDLGLEDMSGFDLLKKIDAQKSFTPPPIIIYTGKDLSKADQMQLKKYSDSIIIKSAKSPERLLDETHLFLHSLKRRVNDPNEDATQHPGQDSILQGKKVLLADDDMRNVFALTSVLESKEMNVLTARNGKEVLQLLKKNNGIDIVLLDIMMPEMDGYEAMKLIRKENRFKNLPIIALTAKAMKGDREKCIQAGANDYQTKPVVTNKLLSQMKVWLSR